MPFIAVLLAHLYIMVLGRERAVERSILLVMYNEGIILNWVLLHFYTLPTKGFNAILANMCKWDKPRLTIRFFCVQGVI